jgi:hypothetical protein
MLPADKAVLLLKMALVITLLVLAGAALVLYLLIFHDRGRT